jgi:hypothetical protein
MWATLALASALSLAPNQNALQLTNPRVSYGFLGATRTEEKLLPGDVYFLNWDIEGLKPGKNGDVQYSIGLELVNPQGKTEFKRDPDDFTAVLSFGGTKLPARSGTSMSFDQAPGTYTFKVTVTDKNAKTTANLERKFEVLPKGFGIIGLHMFQQPVPTAPNVPVPAPAVAFPGQAYLIEFGVVGFQREKDPKNDNRPLPNLTIAFTILDAKGAAVADPWKDEIRREKVDEKAVVIPISIPLEVTRAGTFTLKIEVTDAVAKKTTTVSYPLTVQEIK